MRRWSSYLAVAAGVLTLASFTSAQTTTTGRYDGNQVLRVDLETRADLVDLERSGAVILDCIPGVGPMTVVATPEQRTRIEQRGLNVEVLGQNVQTRIDAQKSAPLRADPFTDFFLDYHPYGDASISGTVVWYMNELVTRYPTLASMVTIGSTLEGRTIWGLRVTNDAIADKPAAVYFGAEHAREWVTPTVPCYFATHLLQNYGTDPVATDLVDNVEFFLIPVFNVDGYLYSWGPDRMWRKNRRNNGDGSWGVDINRNWGEGWGGVGSSGVPGDSTYRGTAAFSEPETQAMRDFLIAHPNVRAQLDIHSYTQLILWPFGYTPDLPIDNAAYEEIGFGMQSLIFGVHGMVYDAGPIYSGIYPVSGGSIDWTYAQRDIFSFSFECRPKTGSGGGFLLPAAQIIPNNEELLPAMLLLSNSDWVRYPIRYRFPNGIPADMSPGSDTVIQLDLVEQGQAIVPGTPTMYYRYDSGGPFLASPLAFLGGQSYEAVFPATNCTSTPEFYFSATGDGGSTVTSPTVAPATAPYAAPVRAVFHSEPLDTDPGWTTLGQWAWGQPTGGGGAYGGPDPTSGHTGANVYGYNLGGDYASSMSEVHLTSTPIDCSGKTGVLLSYWRWLGVEQPSYDHAYVRVSNNGVDWVTVWENSGEVADTAWKHETFDISAVADHQAAVYLRWTMGASDSSWQFCGWNIDDIELASTACVPIPGDFNGDGQVDAADFTELDGCFTGPTGPLGPGCGIFDFDGDNDVDCDDGLAFGAAWTGGGSAPMPTACGSVMPPTATSDIKNRYVSFRPGFSAGSPQAFRITTLANPLFPGTVGLQKWVGAPDADGICRLQCDAAFRLWDMADLDVADLDTVPGATYQIEATLDGVDFLPPATLETVPVWGDVVGPFENGAWQQPEGSVSVGDFTAMLDRFRNLALAPPMSWCDVDPAVPDGVLGILDVTRVIDAFRADPYPFGEPSPCP